MSNKALILQVILNKVTTLVDNSIKMTFVTRELPADEAAVLFSFRNLEVNMLIKQVEIQDDDINSLPDVTYSSMRNEKSPSQRLRAVLYRHWEKKAIEDDFEKFYSKTMERIINHYLTILSEM